MKWEDADTTTQDPSEWWAENAGMTLVLFRDNPPRIHGFPDPSSWVFDILVLLETRGTMSAKQLSDAMVTGSLSYGSVRMAIGALLEKGLVQRPSWGRYTLAPPGRWWLGFHRAIAA